jgi:hypothetical protein
MLSRRALASVGISWLDALFAKVTRLSVLAKAEAALFLSDNPNFNARRWADTHPFQNPGDREHFVEGYLKAGLPK